MITTKTFTMFALFAILLSSFAPNAAFAMTAAEEATASSLITIDSAAQLPVAVPGNHAGPVDVELQLLMDVSGSVDAGEFLLQRTGYSDAFRDPATVQQILGCGGSGTIAVQLIYWSDQQAIGVDWTEVFDLASAVAFANAIDAAARPFTGLTAPGSAINFGVPLFASNAFTAPFQVIDVSGDGSANDGDSTPNARDAALAGEIDSINGIVIGGSATVLAFYTNNVIGGLNAFVDEAASFADFGDAIKNKLANEICVVGGESLSIDTTALILAGAQTNAVWIMSALAVIGSVAFGALYITSKKN